MKFAHCARNGAALNSHDMDIYYNTWLCKNHLMVVEEAVDAEQDEAQGDEDEQDEAQGDEDDEQDEAQGDEAEQIIQLQEEHEQVETKTIRWSFPTFGKMFLELLDGFVTQSTVEMVDEVCMKEPSFAGFWFEVSISRDHQYFMLIIFL